MSEVDSNPSPKKDDSDLKIHGPIRRNALLLSGVVAVLLVGPSISRVLSAYRGVVLEVREGKMLLGWEKKPPDWLDAIEVEPGDIIVKERGAWDPQRVERTDLDHALVTLFKRYNRTYAGTILRINPPNRPGGASTAVIELDDDGGTIHLPLWAEHLATASEGRRVEKRPGSWDPQLAEEAVKITSPE